MKKLQKGQVIQVSQVRKLMQVVHVIHLLHFSFGRASLICLWMMPTAWWCSNNFLISCLQLKIFSTTLTTSTKQYNKKQNLQNQTSQAKFMKPNQTYQTKFTQTNLTTKLIKPIISNQTYQTKLTKTNVPNQIYQSKPTKPNQTY